MLKSSIFAITSLTHYRSGNSIYTLYNNYPCLTRLHAYNKRRGNPVAVP